MVPHSALTSSSQAFATVLCIAVGSVIGGDRGLFMFQQERQTEHQNAKVDVVQMKKPEIVKQTEILPVAL